VRALEAVVLEVAVNHALGAFTLDARFECGGGVTALFGRSGAGKSTLINVIAGLIAPREGRIVVNGDTVLDTARGVNVRAGRRRFGYVFQEGRLFPHLTVRRNLIYAWWFDRALRDAVALEHVVELLGIGPLLARRPADLSGGEKQRVAIGRALLAKPRLLLLDEPLAALDAPRKAEVLGYLRRLRDETRVPMVYVSHSVDELLQLANHVVLLAHGRVVSAGVVDAVMGRPEAGVEGGFFEGGAVIDTLVTAIDATDGAATLAFDGGTLTVGHVAARVGEAVRVRLRAREVSIALEPPQRISIQNILRGRIAALDEAGGDVLVSLQVGAVLLRARITHRAARQLALEPGMSAYALVKAIALDKK
jgi:molybdate transport system ATP-binding protein